MEINIYVWALRYRYIKCKSKIIFEEIEFCCTPDRFYYKLISLI